MNRPGDRPFFCAQDKIEKHLANAANKNRKSFNKISCFLKGQCNVYNLPTERD